MLLYILNTIICSIWLVLNKTWYKCMIFYNLFFLLTIHQRHICMSINMHLYLIVAYLFNRYSMIMTSVICSSEQIVKKLNWVPVLGKFVMHINWYSYFLEENLYQFLIFIESGEGRDNYTNINYSSLRFYRGKV